MEQKRERQHQVEELEALQRQQEGRRSLGGVFAILYASVCAAWSLFQLALPDLLLIDTLTIRAVHLAFALFLGFLAFGARKKAPGTNGTNGTNADRGSSPGRWELCLDVGLGALAALCALYYVLDYEAISMRSGDLSTFDLWVGSALILLLLEAARRSVGPALPGIAALFILYSFVSESMPEIIALKNASLDKVVNKLALSTGGIFGVPLDVSATTVFLFVLFGVMLDRAGGSYFFIQLAYGLLGRYRGGPAKAAVLASGLTGMVSGSSIANTVTTGTFTIPLMKKAGYPSVKAGAIEVAASTNGQLMPPIMGAAAFIMAEYCNMSYFEVVSAAVVPAVVSYGALIYITHLEALKLGLRGVDRSDLPHIKPLIVGALPFLVPLGFLLYQLMVVRRSPQLAVYEALISLMGLMLLRELWAAQRQGFGLGHGLKKACGLIKDALVGGAESMIAIGIAVATAGIVVGIVTLGLGAVITDLIDYLSGGSLVLLLLITAVVSLILGMGLPTTANYIVMASLTVPVILTLSGDMGIAIPLIGAHLFCFYFGILADDTPPVALAAYAASAISKADPLKTGIQGFIYDMRTAILPFMFLFNEELLLIGVNSIWHGAWVFVSALVAMCAFSALTQHWFYRKNRWYESVLLVVAIAVVFRPGAFESMHVPRLGVQVFGVVLVAAVYLMQRFSERQKTALAH